MTIDTPQRKPFVASLKLALPMLLAGVLCGTATTQNAPAARFITIDAPDAVLGTQAEFINQNGSVTGLYYDASQLRHGFFMPAGGSLVEFDPPSSSDTVPTSINRFNQVVGLTVTNGKFVSFIRSANGKFVILSIPGSTDTRALAINDSKQIAGWYTDSGGVTHGFIRQADGSYTFFDEPDAASLGTYAQAMNNSGVVTGYYYDAQQNLHGFVRDATGNFTSFDAPGANGSTSGNQINDNGSIVGFYGDAFNILGSFERDPQGNIQTIYVARSALTAVYGINNSDVVVGVAEANSSQVAFRRNGSGNYSTLSIPPQHITSWGQAVNDSGSVRGLLPRPELQVSRLSYKAITIRPCESRKPVGSIFQTSLI